MKKLSVLLLIVFLITSFLTCTSSAEQFNPPDLDVKAYILIDGKTGQVITENNSDKKLYPASITKVMTAIIAIENGKFDQIMTASEPAIYEIGEGGMNIGIMAGEQMTMKDLLHAMLLKSANEAANIIAENIAGSRQAFVNLMNKKAIELGAKNTHFANPSGAHNPNHFTTAADYVKIAQYAMSKPEFRDIVIKKSYDLAATNKHSTWPALANSNRLIYQSSIYYSHVTGVKPGFTSQAGNTLVSAAIDSNGMELIAVVMGALSNAKRENIYTYSQSLLEYGFQNYSLQKVMNADTIVSKGVKVTGKNITDSVDLVTASELKAALPKDIDSWGLEEKKFVQKNITAPVKKGQVLGNIEYFRNNVSLGKINLVASKSIGLPGQTASKNTSGKLASAGFFLLKALLTLIFLAASFVVIKPYLRKYIRIIRKKKQQNFLNKF